MKKDYTLAAENSPSQETDFIQEFWSEKWSHVTNLPTHDTITVREEFKVMQPFLQELSGASKILDGGCGLGEWTVFFASKGFDAVGMDISATTIARLNAALPACRFVQGDIRDTALPDSSVDLYFSWGTFEHFETGPGDCINEAYRILKPGALLFVSVPYQNWRHILREASPWHQWNEAFSDAIDVSLARFRFYQWRFTPADLRQELEMRGFQVLDIKPIHKREGWRRTLSWDFGLASESWTFKLAARLFPPFIPTKLISHMLIAVAKKASHQG